jgi:hypothetical protein
MQEHRQKTEGGMLQAPSGMTAFFMTARAVYQLMRAACWQLLLSHSNLALLRM